MTFVGKILVLVIMVFALLFLAFSAMVFKTERNWKDARDEIKQQLQETNSKLTTAQNEKAKVDQDLISQKQAQEANRGLLQSEIDSLQAGINDRQNEITRLRTAVETAVETVRSSQDDAEARFAEYTKAQEELRAIQLVTNDQLKQQKELEDQIRILDRQLETAKENNEAIREQNLVYSSKLDQMGVDPTDLFNLTAFPTAPDVDGEITDASDPRNERFQISLGSDDGLLVGHILKVYRFGVDSAYLGDVRVSSLGEDQAVVVRVNKAPLGRKIKEGDIVSTKIRPRG